MSHAHDRELLEACTNAYQPSGKIGAAAWLLVPLGGFVGALLGGLVAGIVVALFAAAVGCLTSGTYSTAIGCIAVVLFLFVYLVVVTLLGVGAGGGAAYAGRIAKNRSAHFAGACGAGAVILPTIALGVFGLSSAEREEGAAIGFVCLGFAVLLAAIIAWVAGWSFVGEFRFCETCEQFMAEAAFSTPITYSLNMQIPVRDAVAAIDVPELRKLAGSGNPEHGVRLAAWHCEECGHGYVDAVAKRTWAEVDNAGKSQQKSEERTIASAALDPAQFADLMGTGEPSSTEGD